MNVLTPFNVEERSLIPRELTKILQKRDYGHIEEKAKHILAFQKIYQISLDNECLKLSMSLWYEAVGFV